MSYDFLSVQQRYIEQIEAALEGAIGVEEETLYGVVQEAMRYSTLGGGKRLRGMLCLELCRLGCGEYERAVPFAAAIEMIHAYSLIHDDLPCMDNDELRRGKPSCHVRFGEANALLAGDALLTRAFEYALRECDYAAMGYERGVRGALTLAQCAGLDGMIGGQAIDLRFENTRQMTPEVLGTLHALKTGALIRAACLMGGIAGGMDEGQLELCEKYAAQIGLAFQIMDDILDVTATSEELGKPVGSDRSSGKTTYVVLYGVEESRKMAQECVQEAKKCLHDLHIEEPFLYDVAEMVISRTH